MQNMVCCLVNCGCNLIRIRKPVWVIDPTQHRFAVDVVCVGGGKGGGLARQSPVAWLGTCDTATDKEKSSAPCLDIRRATLRTSSCAGEEGFTVIVVGR